ncbi:MAG: hypothetical protein FJZ00_12240 [Candidatus Sericytochromatia bacterium]|uniref:Type II secretion system protein GspE N-terminal domain-containing protein n=1 Tax=Candidatus Tanganyikabacteria bacterium TaxID=2961651 RepID=A0A938BM33_9BACT|nr:hypothetical protein [Candidatus Tanganyikabacteria bacterium]
MAVYGKRLRIGEILTRAGVISEAQLQVALAKQQLPREPIGEILISLGYVTSEQIRNALELQYGVKSITLSSSVNLIWSSSCPKQSSNGSASCPSPSAS